MQINIKVTKAELEKMQLNPQQFIDHIIKTLNASDKNLFQYKVNVNDWISKNNR